MLVVNQTRMVTQTSRIFLHSSPVSRRIQLLDVLPVIRNLHTIDFDADEYDIKGRLTRLFDRWGDSLVPRTILVLVRIRDITMSLMSP